MNFTTGRPTERVRRLLKAKRRWWAVPDVAEATWLDKKQVRLILRDMLRRGEVERKEAEVPRLPRERFLWRHTGKEIRWGGRETREVSRRVFRAMHVKGVFTPSEVALLSGANLGTVRWLIRRLKEELECVGQKENARGGLEKLWRIRHRDRFYRKYVLEGVRK